VLIGTVAQIYPPNQTTPIYLAYSSTGCTSTSVNLLTISVVQAEAYGRVAMIFGPG